MSPYHQVVGPDGYSLLPCYMVRRSGALLPGATWQWGDVMAIFINKNIVGLIFSTACLALLAGCQSNSTITQIVAPANSDAAAKTRRVAVLPFSGPDGANATASFESLLSEVKDVNGQPYFTVVDRRTLQHALDELKLKDTGLLDDKTVANIGKFIGAEGVYTGTAGAVPVERTHHEEQRSQCNGAADPKKLISKCTSVTNYNVSCTDKVTTYRMIPRLVAATTGRILYNPTVAKSRSSSFCSDSGEEVADGVLLGGAYADVLDQIRKDVAPHTETMTLAYKTETDGLSEADGKRFKDSLAFAKAGRMDRSCPVWLELAPANPGSIAANYDAALCSELNGDLPAALASYSVVDAKLTKPDNDVSAALVRVRQRIADQQKLAAQAAAVTVPEAAPAAPAEVKKVPKPKKPKPAPTQPAPAGNGTPAPAAAPANQ